MNKFTKGPWIAKQSDRYAYQITIFAENNPSPIGNIYGNLDDIENGANARLIASAPDLLEALESVLKRADNENLAFRPWHEKALLAIAKARGIS